MAHLAISLFGGFHAELDGLSLTDFGTDKNRALLAYLALESGRPHRREALATLLWPNHPEPVARNSLRQALYQLRGTLAQKQETEPHLLIASSQVQFNPVSDHWVDVVEFNSRLTACQSHHSHELSLCSSCLETLQRAVELYQGELLAGFTIVGCLQFSDWQISTSETLHCQALTALTLLANCYETQLAYDQLIACTQRMIELEPWCESAHRRQMWALAMTGQHTRALRQYEKLCHILQHELQVSPQGITRQLYENIRACDLPGLKAAPARLWQPCLPVDPHTGKAVTFFAGRQSELGQLHAYLLESLAGHGRVAFISGEAGSGKTILLNEFARQAMLAHPGLLVISGTCNSYCGLGDPYQPFQETLGTLAGILNVLLTGSMITSEHDWRLTAFVPALMQNFLETYHGTADTLLPAQALLRQVQQSIGASSVSRPNDQAVQPNSGQLAVAHDDSQKAPSTSESSIFQQNNLQPTDLCNQVARLLLAITRRFPLLILLDDLQWLDRASASLLFHLGSHLEGGRILLLGAYRPEDLAPSKDLERHLLVAILHEFQRRFGKMQVDLCKTDDRAFVEAYLDSELNHIDQDFREEFYRHTRGNALFTVELLRSIQARGELIQDKTGQWMQGPFIDWGQLPAKVEAVIAERLSRLDPKSLSLLEAASVQGEVFNTGVLAKVLGVTEDEIITSLSGPLFKQHRLVSSLGPASHEMGRQACYAFRNLLYQKYLYQGLDAVKRAQLQQQTAKAQT